MAEVLLLSIRFDGDETDTATATTTGGSGGGCASCGRCAGAVTVSHPCGRRFVVTEITDDADPAWADDTGVDSSIW